MAKYAVNYDGIKNLSAFSKTINNCSFAMCNKHTQLLSLLVINDKISTT